MSRRKILSWELAKHKGHSLRLMEYATDEDGKSEPGVSLYCARCDRGEAEELLFIPEDSWLMAVGDPSEVEPALGLVEVLKDILFDEDGGEKEISGADFYQEVTSAMDQFGLWPRCEHEVDLDSMKRATKSGDRVLCECSKCGRPGNFKFEHGTAEVQWEEK